VNVVDSSGWLEYFANGSNAGFFAPAVEAVDRPIVPSICLLEVFKRVFQQRGEGDALEAVAVMQQGDVVSLDSSLAVSAAKTSLDLKLPLADSIVLATARARAAVVWTMDADFKGLPGVKNIPKK
jgi:predicted nucleic acid-binding protein